MLCTRSYAATTARHRQIQLRPVALIRVEVTEPVPGRHDVHEHIGGRAVWRASFADEADAKAYARRRLRLAWRVAA